MGPQHYLRSKKCLLHFIEIVKFRLSGKISTYQITVNPSITPTLALFDNSLNLVGI